jgi:hypothetical protein
MSAAAEIRMCYLARLRGQNLAFCGRDWRAKPKGMTRRWRFLGLVLPLGGCFTIGAGTLRRDQANYATAVTEAAKEQTLLNIVRLRYSDPPSFLSVNQIIAGYTIQGGAQAGLNAYAAAAGNFINAIGTFQYEDHPTFTFTPVTGDQYARSYLRPLSPAELLPLAQSGLPIDILFRLTVQSLNGLQSNVSLAAGFSSSAAKFYRAIQGLRLLQESGALSISAEHGKDGNHVTMSFADDIGPPVALRDVRLLLHLAPERHVFEVVYGIDSSRSDVIAILTRPMLGVLGQIGAQIEVPAEAVSGGRTFPTIIDFPTATRSAIVVKSGKRRPDDAYAAVHYRNAWYWLMDDDKNSKVAFTAVEILEALAQSSSSSQAPLVTIPTN